jgi:hypothetical protein
VVFQILTKEAISGSVKGSCFPPAFGGQCSGIPEGCQPCTDLCAQNPDKTEIIETIGQSSQVNGKPNEIALALKINGRQYITAMLTFLTFSIAKSEISHQYKRDQNFAVNF